MPCCAFPLESKPKSRFSAPIGAFEGTLDLHRPQYRGQVDVDAGLLELAAPGLCGGAQRISAHLALRHRGRHRVESTALEMLHLAAFLIGGDDQLVAARSIALQRVSGGLGCGCAVVPVADEHHGTDMACADEGAEIGRIAACEHRCHDELPGPFIETHRGDGAARLGRGGVTGCLLPLLRFLRFRCGGLVAVQRRRGGLWLREMFERVFLLGAQHPPCRACRHKGHHAEHGRDDGGG